MKREEFYARSRNDLPGPLAGLRVVELSTTWAGPMCGCMLADFGADVIKVEHPNGEIARYAPPFLPGTDPPISFMQATVNRNKRSLTLDLHHEPGKKILLKLIDDADIIIENFRPGTMERFGLGYETLRSRKSDIILISISGYGQYGSQQERVGYDPLAQAASGFLSLNGSPEGEAVKSPTFLGDDLSGMAQLSHRGR